MVSAAAQAFIEALRVNKKPPRPLAEARAEWEAEASAEPVPEGTVVEPCTLGGIAGEWVSAGSVSRQGTILLLHGGGYRAGSLVTHRVFAERLSRLTGLRVLVIDYRLAPENPYPAAIEDAQAAFAGLCATGVDAADVVLVGDSAGGGLAIALMLALRDANEKLPGGAVLMSPWTDLQCAGQSYQANSANDPNMDRDDLLSAADDYRGNLPGDDPMLSPIHAELSGLPKMLVQVGGSEIMLDDSVIFAARARAAGSEATLDVTEGCWHVFQNAPEDIPEVKEALDRVAAFVLSFEKDHP